MVETGGFRGGEEAEERERGQGGDVLPIRRGKIPQGVLDPEGSSDGGTGIPAGSVIVMEDSEI